MPLDPPKFDLDVYIANYKGIQLTQPKIPTAHKL